MLSMRRRSYNPERVHYNAKAILTGLLVVTILLWIAVNVMGLIRHSSADPKYSSVGYLFAYLHIFALYPSVLISLAISVSLAWVRDRNVFVDLRWQLTLLLFYITLMALSGWMNRQFAINDRTEIRVVNSTPDTLSYIWVHGRRDENTIQTLLPGHDTLIVHYGNDINYHRRNSYENRIYIEDQHEGKRFRKVIVGTYRAIGNRLVCEFLRTDSVDVR